MRLQTQPTLDGWNPLDGVPPVMHRRLTRNMKQKPIKCPDCGKPDNYGPQRAEDNWIAAPLTSAPYADRGAADESKLVPVPGSLIKSNELARKCRALEAMIPTPILPIPKPRPPAPPAEAYAFQQRIGRNGRGDMGDKVHALTSEAGEDGRGDSAPCVAVTLHGSDKRVTASKISDGYVKKSTS